MNLSTAVFLINDKARMIRVYFEQSGTAHELYKTLDPKIKADDIVIVPADGRLGFRTAKVLEVDVAVDYDSTTQIKWVVGRVDLHHYELVCADEGRAIAAIRDAEANRKRDELRKSLMANTQALKALPIVDISSPKSYEPD